LVEQRIRNAKVASSIPASGTNRIKQTGQFSGTGLFVFCTAFDLAQA
jgi:hypothetical protein